MGAGCAWPALRFGKGNGTVLRPGCRLSRETPFKRLRTGPLMTGIFYRLAPDHRGRICPGVLSPTTCWPHHAGPTALTPERRLIIAASTGLRQGVRLWICKALVAQAPLSTVCHRQRHQPSSGRTAPQAPRHQGRASTPGDMTTDAGSDRRQGGGALSYA